MEFFRCAEFSSAGKEHTDFPFDYSKHAAGAVTSGSDRIHAGRTGMNRLFCRVFLCLSFLLLNAPPAFMPERSPISVQQEAGVQPAVNTDCGCQAG